MRGYTTKSLLDIIPWDIRHDSKPLMLVLKIVFHSQPENLAYMLIVWELCLPKGRVIKIQHTKEGERYNFQYHYHVTAIGKRGSGWVQHQKGEGGDCVPYVPNALIILSMKEKRELHPF